VVKGASRISNNELRIIRAYCKGNLDDNAPHWSRTALNKEQKYDLLMFVDAVEPFLKLKDQLQTRIESSHFNIFCKDLVLLETIHNALEPWVYRVVGPTTEEERDFMLDNGYKKILRDRLPHGGYQYKVYFKSQWDTTDRQEFFKWATQRPDLFIIKLGTEKWLQGWRWVYDPNIYVKDAKTMTVLGLKISGYVRRVDEYILRENLMTA
jgi:hypothetical protein